MTQIISSLRDLADANTRAASDRVYVENVINAAADHMQALEASLNMVGDWVNGHGRLLRDTELWRLHIATYLRDPKTRLQLLAELPVAVKKLVDEVQARANKPSVYSTLSPVQDIISALEHSK